MKSWITIIPKLAISLSLLNPICVLAQVNFPTMVSLPTVAPSDSWAGIRGELRLKVTTKAGKTSSVEVISDELSYRKAQGPYSTKNIVELFRPALMKLTTWIVSKFEAEILIEIEAGTFTDRNKLVYEIEIDDLSGLPSRIKIVRPTID